MTSERKFHELLADFRGNARLFEATLLRYDSLRCAKEDPEFCRQYSQEALNAAEKDLLEDISFQGEDLANLALWLKNACLFHRNDQSQRLSTNN